VFSNRIPSDLTPNRLTQALDQLRAEGRPIIDLTESNPTRSGFTYPPDLLAPLAESHGLALLEARSAVVQDYARRGASVAVDHVVLTASTSDAYSLIFKVLCDPGDEVLVPRPSYPLFEHLTRLDAVIAKPYDLEHHRSWSIDLDSVGRALSSRTRAVLVVSPNNPTGSYVRRDELDRLVRMCGSQAAVVVDEVFADYELKPGSREASGHVLSCRDALVFSLGGLSKSIGLPQAKLGWIAVAGPESVASAALQRLEIASDTYLSTSTLVQRAASELFGRGAPIRDQIHARVVANYRQLSQLIGEPSSCAVLEAEGGWYGVVRVPSLAPEEDLALDLLTTDNVAVHPGYFFDFPRESYLVVSLLPPESSFAEGVRRILRHFDCSTSPA
jgi:alanine-synthesizing transaminase